MKNKFKEVLNIVLILALVTACVGKRKESTISSIGINNNVEVIDVDKAKEKKMLLYSSILEEPDVIVLENNPECVIQNICAIDMYEGNIYILDDDIPALYVFQRDGTFLKRIGHQGRGHGEFLELSDFSIDRENGIIYLWDDALDMAHKYNIRTGKYISSIKTERNGYRSYCMQHIGDRLYISRTSLDVDPENYLLKVVDEKTGEQIASYLNAKDYNKGWNYPLRFPFSYFYSKNTDAPKYVEMFSDTIVSITKDGISPYCVVKSEDFISKERVEKIIKANGPGEDFNFDLSDLYDEDCIHHISRFVELDGMLSFQYMKGGDRRYLLHDLNTKETWVASFFADDYLFENNNIPLDMCYSDEEGVLSVLRIEFIPYFIENVINKGLLNPKIDDYEKLMKIEEGSNPVLFFHKYKPKAQQTESV